MLKSIIKYIYFIVVVGFMLYFLLCMIFNSIHSDYQLLRDVMMVRTIFFFLFFIILVFSDIFGWRKKNLEK